MTDDRRNAYNDLMRKQKKETLTKQEKNMLNDLSIEYLKEEIHSLRRHLEFYKKYINDEYAENLHRNVRSSAMLEYFPEEERSMAQDFFEKEPQMCYDSAKKELPILKQHLFATRFPVLTAVGNIFNKLFDGEPSFTQEEWDKMNAMDDANTMDR